MTSVAPLESSWRRSRWVANPAEANVGLEQLLVPARSIAVLDSVQSLSLMQWDQSVPSPRLIRFGVFELDLRSGELQKQGRKIRLEGQPVQILICLLENPGELVTREELHRKLWPADTFVNFEHGLNTAVKRLRQALNDSADNPRFVETLPRRGYRFIAPIQAVAAGGDVSAVHVAARCYRSACNPRPARSKRS